MNLAAVDNTTAPSVPNPAHDSSIPPAHSVTQSGAAGKAFADVSSSPDDIANSAIAPRERHAHANPGNHLSASLVAVHGDNLWNIASRYTVPGATRYQKMVAIFNANPHAFSENDMARLQAGARLSIPALGTILAIDAAEAERICAGHIDASARKRHGTVRQGDAEAAAPAPLKARDSVVAQFGDTLGAIAKKYPLADATMAQKIVAIFNANPQAFSGGNMNLLKTGAKLTMPEGPDVAATAADAAQGMVNEHWLEYQRQHTA
jgi:FimV-like protein